MRNKWCGLLVVAVVFNELARVDSQCFFKDLGCWRDTSVRAIPGVDSSIEDGYPNKKDNIRKCADYAKSQGFNVFAVQNGGQCFTGPEAVKTYRKYGPIDACKADGRGGKWANQVYSIIEQTYNYVSVGCYKDTAARAIPVVEKRFLILQDKYNYREDAIRKCASVAADQGYEVFAVQNGGQCFTSKRAHRTYDKFGESDACKEDGKGGPFANEVYRIIGNSKNPIKLTDLGCWKDTGDDRAIPSIDDQIGGDYGTRAKAIKKCAQLAYRLGYRVFGVQNGGHCRSGPDAAKTFKKHGPSFACKDNGRGGPWGNQVYEINAEHQAEYAHIGCYKDTSTRAIPTVEKRYRSLRDAYKARSDAIQKCAEVAAAMDYKAFAVQDGGWCATSPNAHKTFNKYGNSTTCVGDGEGGPWGNDVYRVIDVKSMILNDLGCWKDTTNRSIPNEDSKIGGTYATRFDALRKCAELAHREGNDIFGVQAGGQCFTGPKARDTFSEYGPSTACQADGEGGGWANQVYEIDTTHDYTTESVGCYKDTGNRAIPTVEGRFLKLRDSYTARTDAIKKCATVAASLGYRMFAVQNGGWCATSDTAHNTYDKYGPSNACKTDGEGGPWANAVYKINYSNGVTEYDINDMGCWKDTKTRAIPDVDDELDGPYKSREHAIEKCAKYAAGKGYKVFAIQDGGECLTGPNARSTFHIHGPSTACKGDGKGGQWANRVYELNPDLNYDYKAIGCYVDKGTRAIATIENRFLDLQDVYGTRTNAVEKCAKAAATLGYKMFAVQNGGWCATSDTVHNTFNIYGPSTKCDEDGEGGPWANQVYNITYESAEELKIGDLGCWRDTAVRAIPEQDRVLGGSYKLRHHAINKCARLAHRQGYKVFAVQDGGWCATGPNARNTYWKFGPSTACKTDGKGGPWANQVYEINPNNEYSYSRLGCFKDTGSRAIPTAEGRFVKLRDAYRTRKNALKKCADIAARTGNSIFAVQHGGWCAMTDNWFTYNKYGPSTACKADGKGGVWANEVYKIDDGKNLNIRDLGCWKDTSKDAIDDVDDELSLPYKMRPDAIRKCALLARNKGHKIFALRDGGSCLTAADAKDTYKKYGSSTACKLDGKGGSGADQVYEIITSPREYNYSYIGCFRDTGSRAIAPIEKMFLTLHDTYTTRVDAIQKCADATLALGNKVFAVQHGGWCASAANAEITYSKYGTSTGCRADGEGGPWANAIYEIRDPNSIQLNDLGCWRDETSNPAIPDRDATLHGSYKSRPNAIRECAKQAHLDGNEIFAIGDGGKCFSGRDARKTYQKYGPSTDCNANGRGAKSASQVYEINISHQYEYSFVGCYGDTATRAIPTVEKRYVKLHDAYKSRPDAIKKCADIAAVMHYPMFAVQDGGWCATSDLADETYSTYGPSTACKETGKGGPWANAVYRMINFKEMTINDLGCWKDTSVRAVPDKDNQIGGAYKSRVHAVKKCAEYAHRQGFNVFAVQDGGWCATGLDAKNTYRTYGPSFACKSDGEGGPWANQVYEINPRHKYGNYSYVGCFLDKASRAIPTVEGRFNSLRDNYTARKDAIEKCAHIAVSLGHRMFAVQNGGWCATSEGAEDTYNVYGPSDACKADGEGGPWANAVYRINECE